ncbi:aspartate/glutamate racemase family protein [Undibacterium sp. TJN19]|uniref:aspartate/glutamate racemase family protein n=1 Tax=Undibacterium sp. TJN19 TaxID=3413055 RepID=UPI003BF34F72
MQNKTIGLIGGIGWASSAEYYRMINELMVERMGIAHSARIILSSLNQFDFTSRAALASPLLIEDFLVDEVARLKAAGADFFLLCANGAHRFVPAILPRLGLPLISIIEACAQKVEAAQISRVALLGVKQTMSGHFYHDRLAASGITTLTPTVAEQNVIHDIIYTELIHNRMTANSRRIFVDIIEKLAQAGAEGVILGCTEIPLLIDQHHVSIPVFNTNAIHCEAAVAFAFDDSV